MAVIKSLSDKSSSGDDGDDQRRSGDEKLSDESDDEQHGDSEQQIVLSGQRSVRTEFEENFENTKKNAVHGYTVQYPKDNSEEEEQEDAEPRQSEMLPIKSPVDSQVKPRGRGRAKGYKKGDAPKNKPRTSDSCIKNKCMVDVAMRFFHLKVLKSLNEKHITALAKTPFLHLFSFPIRTQVNNALLHEILLMWDNKGHFVFRDKELKFTADEVALAMCLGKNGAPVVYKRDSVITYRMRHKYFPEKGNREITRSELEKAILKAIADKEDPDEVVGLLVLYLFTTVLFPQTTGHVPIHMFRYVENLGDLKEHNWSDGVYRMLMDNIPNNAIWCQLKKGGKNADEVESSQELEVWNRKKKKASGTLPGCALALVVWFFEHVKILKLNKYTGHIPRYMNWNMSITWRRVTLNPYLVDVKDEDVNGDPLRWNDPELLLQLYGFIAYDYIEDLKSYKPLLTLSNKHLLELLKQLTPIFWIFGMKPCKDLIRSNPKQRYDELSYKEEKPKGGSQLPDLSPNSEAKYVDNVRAVEWRNYITKKLMTSPAKKPKVVKEKPGKGVIAVKEPKGEKVKTKSSNDKNYVFEKTPPRDKTNKSDNPTSRKLFNTTPRKSPLDKLQQDLNQGKRSPRLCGLLEEEQKEKISGKETKQAEESVVEEEKDGGGIDTLAEEKEEEIGEGKVIEEIGEGEESKPDVELEKNGSPFLETFVEIERWKDQKRRMGVLNAVIEPLTFKRRLKSPKPSPKLSPKQSPNAVLGLPVCDVGQDGPKKFNLGLMDFPSFSLGLTQTPVKDKEVEVVKESPIIEEKPSTKEKEGDVVKRSPVLEVPIEVEHVQVAVEVSIAEEPFFKKANNKRGRKKDPSDKLVPTRVQPRRNAKKRPKSDKKKKPKTEKDSEIEEMESTTQEGDDIEQEIEYIHEKGAIGADFQTWIVSAVRETNVKLPVFVFKSAEQYKDWSFITDSILSENGDPPCSEKIPLADKKWEYPYRCLLSDQASNVLDAWITKYEQNEFTLLNYPFRNGDANVFCSIHEFKDLLFATKFVGSEIVEIACFLMQLEVPVQEEWFFLLSYVSDLAPTIPNWNRLLEIAPQLCCEQFSKARWLFLPLCDLSHWILAAIDLKKKEIKMYNSCHEDLNEYYIQPHLKTLEWLKFFLAWRMGDEEWINVEYVWQNDVPKQSKSFDCAIFVIRYIDCLIRNAPMDFDQSLIRKERLNLAYNLLIHYLNDCKWSSL